MSACVRAVAPRDVLHMRVCLDRSVDLAFIAKKLVIMLPLARAASLLLLWVLPAPHAAHVMMQWTVEFMSLFVNHDVFALALGIMILEIPEVAGHPRGAVDRCA